MHQSTTEHWRALDGERPPPGEFLPGVDERPDAIVRRTFLKLMGASTALAGLGGCTGGVPDKIVPYAHRPPELTPGIAQHYATSMSLDGYATGLIVESHEGRPTKVEGNPAHPASLGAAGALEQAWVLGLYDPCRAQSLRLGTEPRSWSTFLRTFGPGSESRPGLHFLLEPTSSPLLRSLIERIRAARPDASFHFHAPLAPRSSWDASRALLGRTLVPQFDLSSATPILALDSDFLASGSFHLSHARHFAARRAPSPDGMNRLYVVEPCPDSDGHRGRSQAGPARLRGRARGRRDPRRGRARRRTSAGRPRRRSRPGLEKRRAVGADLPFVRACARDLVRHAGTSLVVAGDATTDGRSRPGPLAQFRTRERRANGFRGASPRSSKRARRATASRLSSRRSTRRPSTRS